MLIKHNTLPECSWNLEKEVLQLTQFVHFQMEIEFLDFLALFLGCIEPWMPTSSAAYSCKLPKEEFIWLATVCLNVKFEATSTQYDKLS